MEAGSIGAPGQATLSRRLEAPSARYGEKVIYGLLAACAVVSVATTLAILISLLVPSIEFFGEVPITDFLFGTNWAPTFEPAEFGVLPIVVGTLSVTFWGLLF